MPTARHQMRRHSAFSCVWVSRRSFVGFHTKPSEPIAFPRLHYEYLLQSGSNVIALKFPSTYVAIRRRRRQ